jgi:hypothetical protein
MGVRHTLAAGLACVLLVQSTALAQTPSESVVQPVPREHAIRILLSNLSPGTEVRVQLATTEVVGRFVEISDDELVLMTSGHGRWSGRRTAIRRDRAIASLIRERRTLMKAGCVRRAFVAVLLTLTPALTFAAPKQPAWVSKVEAGSQVQVVMQAGESFDAIWMGRDSDRAVFERLYPDETVSVPIASVRRVRLLRQHSAELTVVGVATGYLVGITSATMVLLAALFF